jgi:hypothetical protein
VQPIGAVHSRSRGRARGDLEMNNARFAGTVLILLGGLGATASAAGAGTTTRVTGPMACTRGPSGQRFDIVVSAPPSVPEGTVYTVRLDGTASGKLTGTGLNYLHDMSTSYMVPAGSTYVPGSARVVPGSGSENVRAAARATHEGGVVRLTLPARVAKGDEYTPPSLEFQVKAGAAGASLSVGFLEHRLQVNAFLVGDLQVVCAPAPTPFPLAVTRVTAR